MEGLNEILMQLSAELGIGIEFLKANFITNLPEIGRYLFAKQLMDNLMISIIVGGFFMVIPIFVCLYYRDEVEYDLNDDELIILNKKLIKLNLLIYLGINIIPLISISIPYLASPKFWTIQKLMEMIK